MPYADKAKQRKAKAESARRRRALKKSAAQGSTPPEFHGEPLLSLRTIDDTLAAAERAVQLVLNDSAADSVSRARIILQAAATAARAIESSEIGAIERRIAEMEQRVLEHSKPRG